MLLLCQALLALAEDSFNHEFVSDLPPKRRREIQAGLKQAVATIMPATQRIMSAWFVKYQVLYPAGCGSHSNIPTSTLTPLARLGHHQHLHHHHQAAAAAQKPLWAGVVNTASGMLGGFLDWVPVARVHEYKLLTMVCTLVQYPELQVNPARAACVPSQHSSASTSRLACA